MHKLVHTLSNVLLGGTMAQGAARTGRARKNASTPPEPKEQIGLEVPVHRLAEYVPASFTAATANENDPLNTEGARWYKTGDDKIMLVVGEDVALEFNSKALCALSERATSMSVTDVDDLLGLA